MTYDITFFPKADGERYEDAFAAHRARVGNPQATDGDRMRSKFDHLANALLALDARFERRDGNGFVEVCDRTARIQLHLFADDVVLTAPIPKSADDAQQLAQRFATITPLVEQETGYRAFDPQRCAPAGTSTTDIARTADEMMRLRRRIVDGVDRTLHGDD